MLDETTTPEPSADQATPAPETRPRRRRAASRPAGAPVTVESAPTEVPQTQGGQASVVSSSDAQAESPVRPKRRRATRQAGSPAPVPAPEPVVTAPAETAVDDEPAEDEPAEDETAEAVAEQGAVVEEAGQATDEAGQEAAAEADGAQDPEPEVTTSQVAESEPAAESEATSLEQAADETPERPARARRSRTRKSTSARRSTRRDDEEQAGQEALPVAEADVPAHEADAQQDDQADDGVDAALAAATAAATGRRRRTVSATVANPFLSPESVGADGAVDKQAALDSLAASIATGEDQQAEQSDDQAEEQEARPTRRSRRSRKPRATEEQAQQDEASNQEEQSAEGSDKEQDSEQSDEQPARRGGRRRARASDDEKSDENTTEDEDESAADDSEDSADDEEGSGPRRRRRRRGGRRRRRSGDTDEQSDSDSGDESSDDSEEESEDEGEQSEAKEGSEESGRRRRRRRRRRGEDASGSDDDPSDVVVRVREPRRAKSANDEVTGIDGSTRMEAKRQRRREGRAAGRRRAPILSEAEFLARRESVTRRMVIRQNDEYTQLAVLEDDVLVEHYVDRVSSSSLIGNIYLGRVQNVLPSMEAAFIDIGRGRNAVLYAGEIDWDRYGAAGQEKKVENVLKSGQTVLVQVSKDPVGAKGARLTSHISLPGRYVVYSPGGHLSGISRKLADAERHRLKQILGEVVDDKSSVIVRTAAEGASEEELVSDVNRLKAQWEVIEKKSKQGSAPQQLYSEPDLTVRIVRDLFTEDFSELVVAGNGGQEDAYEVINGYVTHVAPHLAERLTHWDTEAQGDPFAKYRIDEQISKALERKVFLPSGGSLVIDRTEAMTVIDVNTGKFTGTGGNLEATVTSNNLEAAEEIVRQLRLRDLGGIIVVDFIDMVLPSNRELLLRRLVECLGRDRTRHQVAEVTSLGLVQMTRKRIGTGLAEAFTVECEHCGGRGYARHDHPVETQAPADGGDRHHGRRGRKN